MILTNIRVAVDSIRQNVTRFVITALIISIGIMALVGMLTSIDGIKYGLTKQFSSLGANSFNIRNRASNVQFGSRGKKQQVYRAITWHEATRFKEMYRFPAKISISYNCSWNSVVRYENRKTNPNIAVMASDENYLDVAGFQLFSGRNFSEEECREGQKICLIGEEIKLKFFKSINPIGKYIYVGPERYRVIGVLESKGNSMAFSGDRMVVLPLQEGRTRFSRSNASYVLSVAVFQIEMLETAIEEATSRFRNIRGVTSADENNFEITRSDSITQKLFENLEMVTLVAIVIALITLLGAAIGLMNILLVSVTERTREVGTRKALGATRKDILYQFLTEAIVICVLGGAGGILLGIIAGNLVGGLVGAGFIIPWNWMLLGVSVCIVTGVAAGIIPASRAAKMEPVEALRHE